MAEEGARGAAGIGWVLLSVVTGAVGVAVFAAACSVVAEVYPFQPAGFAVAGIALFLAFVLPIGIGTGLARTARRRGWNAPTLAIVAGTIALVNIGGVVGIQVLGPDRVKNLLMERGTWVVDAMTGQGPYGPPALPVIARRLDEVASAHRVID